MRKVGEEIDKNYPKLDELLENMWETMYNASGVGLAAPQVGLPIRVFVIDTTPPFSTDEDLSNEEKEQLNGFKKSVYQRLYRRGNRRRMAF